MKNNYIKGQIILLTVLVLGGALLGVSTIAGYLMVLKIREASDVTNATKAIYAAETGIQWELYKTFKNNSASDVPVMTNKTTFESSSSDQKFQAIGESARDFRAIEMKLVTAPTSTIQ
jgi:hypothetical protein